MLLKPISTGAWRGDRSSGTDVKPEAATPIEAVATQIRVSATAGESTARSHSRHAPAARSPPLVATRRTLIVRMPRAIARSLQTPVSCSAAKYAAHGPAE